MTQMISMNPYTGKQNQAYQSFDLGLLDDALSRVSQAQKVWAEQSLAARAQYLQKLASLLREKKDELARLATSEMGKTLSSAAAEVEKCAWVCEYYAEQGAGMLATENVSGEGLDGKVMYQPMGVILAIMPWNFPYWQVFRFLAPALMAGNAAVLKHASNVPGCALAIESLCREAGLDEDLFRTLLVSGSDSARVIRHPLIQAVTFTGSTDAGRKVAAEAGQYLKKTVLELGGSDPYLVLDDADVGKAVESCVTSRLLNNGQSCIAAKRFIVDEKVYGAFVAGMADAMAAKSVGDPMQSDIDIGPQARDDLSESLAHQVEESIRLGAVLVTGGKRKGSLFWPTVLGEVRPGMPAFDEELFGPVAAVIRARDEASAVALANQSEFGLGGAVFSRDTERAERVARQLQVGAVAINDFVKSDPRMPFGGVKASGYGRELSVFGIREFTNIKSLVTG
ncbi:NAD-dependent succinate-semialdehyde dehydrogenase [Pseudohongiella nitratireducens]|uniref:NAD-dependent succinate-semialdehyde dehydrogenase n=1 Tax=Pseudohongiella nitratireducens TaxID=1768907 RepID=UPI002409A697|nr:NAD-dependent succinate-semialdehyde dehydrogenase [Pseudohongiella nitratireducens]MDF1623174.1 NAD-dependent succinate-semialdehyde dehydrogenase [Pseudohongiella nitratireducens]